MAKYLTGFVHGGVLASLICLSAWYQEPHFIAPLILVAMATIVVFAATIADHWDDK